MAAALSMIGIGIGAVGAISSGIQSAEAMEYNATVAVNDAEHVKKQAEIELHKHKTAQRALLARQVAVTAASGRSFSGSPLDVIARSESNALLDEYIINYNATTAQGRLYGEAAMLRHGADQERGMGYTKAVFSALTGGIEHYKTFTRPGNTGLTSGSKASGGSAFKGDPS